MRICGEVENRKAVYRLLEAHIPNETAPNDCWNIVYRATSIPPHRNVLSQHSTTTIHARPTKSRVAFCRRGNCKIAESVIGIYIYTI